jgi:hypothetical protein
MTGPLSAGEWEALLCQTPDSVRALVYRLAVHHGAVEPPESGKCPVCGKVTAEQLELEATR